MDHYKSLGITPNREYSLAQAGEVIGVTRGAIQKWIRKNNEGEYPISFRVIVKNLGGKKIGYKLKGSDVLKLYIHRNGQPN